MESILTSIKKLLGITEEYEQFDPDIIIHINSVFLTLAEIGVGPVGGFYISDATATWDDFIPNNDLLVNAVKSYMYLKVRMLFDPSLTTSVTDLMKAEAQELEWRMNVLVDPPTTFFELGA